MQKATSGFLGTLTFQNLTWPENQPLLKPDFSLNTVYEKFLDLIEDFNYVQMVTEPTRQNNILGLFHSTNPTQMVTEPTRQNNILGLFHSTNPTLVNQVGCHAGPGDHDLWLLPTAL